MCNGTFEDKDPDEVMEYLDLLAENAQNQDTTGTCETLGKTQPHTSNGGIYNLMEDHDLQVSQKSRGIGIKKEWSIKTYPGI